MDVQDLRSLLDYHYWARDRLLEAVEPLAPEQLTGGLGSSFRAIRDPAAHIYASEWAWYSRWQGQSPTAQLSPEKFPDVPALRAAWMDLEAQMRAFLESLGEKG